MTIVRLSTDGIFYTVQGEGPLIGTPSLFVRLDVCNLKCRWGQTLCDASYTSWTPSGTGVVLEALCVDLVTAMKRLACRHVVITGGEPALQPDVCRALATSVSAAGGHTTLETNGTIYFPNSGLDLICLSPKLRSSVPVGSKYEKVHERNRWNPDAIKLWMARSVGYYFKYVIDREEDIAEVLEQLKEVGQPLPDPAHVVFMPQGITVEELWERGRWVAEKCKALGVRFSPRLQIDLYGNRAGT